MSRKRLLPTVVVLGVALSLLPAGAFGASTGCPAAQLKIGGALAKAAFGCYAKFAKNPAKDPGKVKLDACLDKAEARFRTAYEKAPLKYNDCVLGDPVDEVIQTRFATPIDALVSAIVVGQNPLNRTDNALRAALLKEAGGAAGKWLSSWSRWAKKPDAMKLVLASLKADERAFIKMYRAILKCEDHGLFYYGLPPAAILARIYDAVTDLAEAAAGVRAYTLEGTSEWMGCRDSTDDGLHTLEGFAFMTGIGGGPASGGWFVLVDSSDPGAGALSGNVTGGVLDAVITYVDDSRGTGTCTGPVGDPAFSLACEGQDTRGDTCSWTADVDLVRD